MSDLLLILGLASLVTGAFLLTLIAGLAVLGVVLVVLSLALQDGQGVKWRS